MNSSKTAVSISIIYWLTTIAFYLMILVGCAALLFNVLLYTQFFGNDLQLHMHFPSEVSFLDKGVLELHGQTVEIELVEARARIHFFNTPLFIARPFAFCLLIALGFGLYITIAFKQFISNVRKQIIFEIKNIVLLKRLAYGLLGLWLFTLVYLRVVYYYIALNSTIEGVAISDQIPNYSMVLFAAFFIWILAHIFGVGIKLQEEAKLTI